MNQIGIILIIAAIILFKSMKAADKPIEITSDQDDQNISRALKKVADKYGKDEAKVIEQIYRLETAHFTSGQFKKTLTPGMWAIKKTYPFGWGSLRDFVEQTPEILPTDFTTTKMMESAGHEQDFVVFPTIDSAVMFVAFFLNKYSWNAGRWHSTDPVKQEKYTAKLAKISTPISNLF